MSAKTLAAASLALALTWGPGLAHAADAGTTNDLRCVIVAAAMAGTESAPPEAKSSGTMTALYFLGKLDGRSPSFNLEDGVIDQMMSLTPDQLRAEAKRCAGELALRGHALVEIGKRLQDRAKTLKPNPGIPN